jgi:hypothetical protein
MDIRPLKFMEFTDKSLYRVTHAKNFSGTTPRITTVGRVMLPAPIWVY